MELQDCNGITNGPESRSENFKNMIYYLSCQRFFNEKYE